MRKSILLCLALIFLVRGQTGFVGTQFEKGAINYSERKISAVGIGFVPENVINAGQARRAALRIAKQDALRLLIEIVNGVVVTSETTMTGAMLDDVIKSRVEGAVRGAVQVGEPKYLSDTSIEVTYEVPMSGITEIILPSSGWEAVPSNEGEIAMESLPPPKPGMITGLIIDTKGLGIKPAMSPQILDQNGGIIYGIGNFSREYAVQYGVVGYSKDLNQAMEDLRVVGNPLVVKGVGVAGTHQTDVIISNQDVFKVNNAESSAQILKNCKVMFILD
tara:strand:- start:3435 stop:4262 length:828 start_codon:yes stop_codon:yes gene_type:complete